MLDLDRSLLVVEPQPPARPTTASMCTAAGWGWHRIRGCCRQGRGRGDVAICAHSRHQGRASRPHVSASNGPGAPAVPQQPTPGGHGCGGGGCGSPRRGRIPRARWNRQHQRRRPDVSFFHKREKMGVQGQESNPRRPAAVRVRVRLKAGITR